MPDERHLIGEDSTVVRVLEKVELAARRVSAECWSDSPQYAFEMFSVELAKITKDIGR